MEKRTKIIGWVYKKIELNRDLFKTLLPVLPIVFLLSFTIITLILNFPFIESFIFLIDLFLKSGKYILNSGEFVFFSTIGVIIIFIFLLGTIKLFESQLDEKNKNFEYIFLGSFLAINAFLFSSLPCQ